MKPRTHEDYQQLTGGIHRVLEIIRHDRTQLGNLPHDRTDGFFRRTLLRQLFADLEVQLFQLRLLLQIACEAQLHDFTPGEISVLFERMYTVDDKGNVKQSRQNLRTDENIQFVFKLVANVTGNTEIIDRASVEWGLLKKTIEKRNLVTHPRLAKDFDISDSDFQEIAKVGEWLDRILGLGHKQLNDFFSRFS